MGRYKLDEKDKKVKSGFAINIELNKLLEKHLDELKINKSKYIEKLIREDMISRGYEIKNKFEK